MQQLPMPPSSVHLSTRQLPEPKSQLVSTPPLPPTPQLPSTITDDQAVYNELFDLLLPAPDKEISTILNKLHEVISYLSELDRRLTTLEETINSFSATKITGSDQKSTMLKMILADKALGWKVAMRKVLQMTFGQNTLAVSCAVGQKYSKNATLDQTKLNTIKGKIMSSCYKHTLSTYFRNDIQKLPRGSATLMILSQKP